VNVRALVSTLNNYDHRQLWYLGRPSIRAPLEILNRDDVTVSKYEGLQERVSYEQNCEVLS